MLSTATAAEMSTKYGQVFKLNYTVHKGFHVQLKIPNANVIHDFPSELDVVSEDFHLMQSHFMLSSLHFFFSSNSFLPNRIHAT